ncbi:Cys-tRNA(Pro) deacylase [Microbulbifer sp. A4B17]|uniref:Cys-tRNA(Pro) deacylase n=1 Tax=Microbulbifer sp. A4B17 TaxID=359370 RepID=UPI000D52D9C6|nr:Cys-tRNA(Pro) deacylase [Microbulbifer sp. A4B17]AWF82698.1 Cys-tRNA(Pro) deacylase [Microbulbifer sp. A4B17]
MTPGINLLKNSKVSYKIHEYAHDSSTDSYGMEAAQELGVSEERIFKTLVVALDNKELAVGIVPVSTLLNMKLIAKAAVAKKAVMAAPEDVERSTGYVLGGVSPLGQKRQLKTILDISIKDHSTVFVSAGRRGLEIELSPNDLIKAVNGVLAKISQ